MAKLTPEELNELISVYVGYFNRAPDPKGLQNYVDKLEAEPPTTDIATIANNFANSPEALGQYPYLATPGLSSTTAFITSIYKNLFNREPDADGLAYWEDKLDSGVRTPGEMILAIIKGAVGGDDKAIIDNKIAAALDFVTDAANTPGFVYDDAAHQAAKDTLSNITADEQSVTDAGAATDAFLAGATGVTYTLTTGPDALTGGAGNDTFNALPVNVDGDNATTFSGFDNLDGGAGTDTLNIFTTGEDNDGFPSVTTVKNIEIVNILNDSEAGEDGNFGEINASKFEGATQIWQVGSENDVVNLAATTTAGFRNLEIDAEGADEGINIGAAAAAESITIALDNVTANEDGGDKVYINVDGTALNAVNISGSIVANDASSSDSAYIDLDMVAGKNVETVSVTTDIKTEIDDLSNTGDKGVITLDASASTGGIVIDVDDLTTISTGSGDDDVTMTNSAKASTISTGDGKDTINFAAASGVLVVDAGIGDDEMHMGNHDLTAKDAIDGGEGDDSLSKQAAATYTDDELVVLRNVVSNVETLILNDFGVTEIDVSKLQQKFANVAFDLEDTATVTGVTTENIIAIDGTDLDVTSDGYDVKPADSTGDLSVIARGAGAASEASEINAYGDNLTLTVEADGGDLWVDRLLGDVKTAEVNLVTAVNSDGDEQYTAAVSTNANDQTGFLENMTSFTVTGNGVAVVQNEGTSKLATIDASGLASTFLADTTVTSADMAALDISPLDSLYGDDTDYAVGDKGVGLIFASDNAGLKETVTLGDGVDILSLQGASTVGKTDVITGLNLVTDTDGELTNQSDFLTVNGFGYVKLSASQNADIDGISTVEAALTLVADYAQDNVVFQLNGDTFVYNDFGGNDLVDLDDGLVQLTGLIDLDDLLASLNFGAP